MPIDPLVVPSPSANLATESSDELNIGELLSIIWAGRYAVLAFILTSLVISALYLIDAKPVYEADGTVQVELNGKNSSAAMGDMASLFGAPMETQAEIQILQSRMVFQKVISNLKLEIKAEPHYFPLFGAFVARRRANGDSLASPLLGLNQYAWGGEHIDVTQFDVPVSLIGQRFILSSLDDEHFSISLPDGSELIKGEVGKPLSAKAQDGIISIFVKELKANPGTEFILSRSALADVIGQLQSNVKVSEAGKQSGVISLEAQGPTPSYAANVIKQIEDAYVRQNVERRSAEAEQSLEFLQQQLPELRARVDVAQSKLNAYQLKQGSVNVTKETEIVLDQAVDFETKRLELLNTRQQAIQRFTAQHPTVQAIDAQLRQLESEQADIKKRSEKLPETQQEILSLMRDLEVNTQIYTTLLNSAQELQIAKAGTVGNVRIIDYPLIPTNKSKPNAPLILAGGAVLGLVFGVVFLFLRQALLKGVDRPDEVEKAFGLATYAAIPYTATQKKLALAMSKKQGGPFILADIEPDDVAIESLRSLRTSLQFALLEAPNNIIMFTGPSPGLGKSFVSINLGVVLARSGKRVAVVDCDLRRGHLHKYFGQDAFPGLSDYIAAKCTISDIVRKTSVEGMSLVANGTLPPNPSELLLHERFSNFLQQLSESNDFVILDTPPVLPVADAGVIGRLAGCVLLVLKEGAHPLRMIEETARRLRQAGVTVRGTIFNQVGQRGGGYGYYYSSYSYTYGTKYESEHR